MEPESDIQRLWSADKTTVEDALTTTLEKINAGTLDGDLSLLCEGMLMADSKHNDLAAKVCEVIATLARDAEFRVASQEHSTIKKISVHLYDDESDVRLQAMRAVGNLCIDNDTNREAVADSGSCPAILSQLNKCLDPTSPDSQSVKMKCVTCGFVLNLSNENEKLQKVFVDLDVLPQLGKLLSVKDQDESVVELGLRAISVLVDTADLSGPTPLPSTVSLLLSRCTRGELDLMEDVLEILETLVNKNDELKRGVVEQGCVDYLLGPLEADHEQKANDILVTLLSEDKCLESLFKSGKVLSRALSCLEAPSSSLQQRASAALLLANMARSEENCRVLVEKGAVPLLVALTKMEESKEMMGKLHHSALSALRNLSLPAAHKQLFLDCGVVEASLSLLTTSSLTHVWFKALGALRLLVDNQAPTCSYIVSQSGSIQRVCEVCSAVGPAHLQQEGSRLLAAIVKNSHNNDVMCGVVTGGGTRWLCGLLVSEHTVMVNEGLVSLNLLAAINSDLVHSALTESEVNLATRLIKAMTSPSSEIVSNALLLLETLMSCDHNQLKASLRSNEELTLSLSELTKHSARDVSHRATELLSMTT